MEGFSSDMALVEKDPHYVAQSLGPTFLLHGYGRNPAGVIPGWGGKEAWEPPWVWSSGVPHEDVLQGPPCLGEGQSLWPQIQQVQIRGHLDLFLPHDLESGLPAYAPIPTAL